jgi:hypothetical protein
MADQQTDAQGGIDASKLGGEDRPQTGGENRPGTEGYSGRDNAITPPNPTGEGDLAESIDTQP